MILPMLSWWKGSLVINNASARSLIMAAKALSNSSGLRTATGSSFIPNVSTARRNSATWAGREALSGFQRIGHARKGGTTSLRSCSLLPATSGPRMVFPVMFLARSAGQARGLGRTSPRRPAAVLRRGLAVVRRRTERAPLSRAARHARRDRQGAGRRERLYGRVLLDGPRAARQRTLNAPLLPISRIGPKPRTPPISRERAAPGYQPYGL